MLRLFRNMRIRLIKEGKVQRYLVYAFGEIVLLVIGILLALQINGWNQQRSNQKLEQVYLQRFHDDLTEDIEDIHTQMAYGRAGLELIREAMVLLHQESVEADLFRINDFYDQSYMVPLRMQVTTYRELESTGRLNLIRNEDLRRAILKHYDSYQQMDSGLDVMSHWHKAVSRDMDADTSVLKYTTFTKDLFSPEQRYDDDYSYLNDIEDPRFRKIEVGFGALGFWINFALWTYEEMLPQIEALRDMIEEELEE